MYYYVYQLSATLTDGKSLRHSSFYCPAEKTTILLTKLLYLVCSVGFKGVLSVLQITSLQNPTYYQYRPTNTSIVPIKASKSVYGIVSVVLTIHQDILFHILYI